MHVLSFNCCPILPNVGNIFDLLNFSLSKRMNWDNVSIKYQQGNKFNWLESTVMVWMRGWEVAPHELLPCSIRISGNVNTLCEIDGNEMPKCPFDVWVRWKNSKFQLVRKKFHSLFFPITGHLEKSKDLCTSMDSVFLK